jgi:hypothetical protein
MLGFQLVIRGDKPRFRVGSDYSHWTLAGSVEFKFIEFE